MFASQFVSSTNGFNNRQRIAAEMLMIGVAFQRTGTEWDVISIEGDHIGVLSTFVLSETACMLKKAGLKSNAAPEFFKDVGEYVTFAHDPKLSRIPQDEIDSALARRFKNPVTLM